MGYKLLQPLQPMCYYILTYYAWQISTLICIIFHYKTKYFQKWRENTFKQLKLFSLCTTYFEEDIIHADTFFQLEGFFFFKKPHLITNCSQAFGRNRGQFFRSFFTLFLFFCRHLLCAVEFKVEKLEHTAEKIETYA